MEVLSQAKEGEALFLNTWGKTLPRPQPGLQTSSLFAFGKGRVLASLCLAHLPSSLLGGADFVLTVGWAVQYRLEECLSSWPNSLFGSWRLLLLYLLSLLLPEANE